MTEQRSKRRLAAILAADVVGYSRLMQADEAGTVTALKTRRRDVLEPLLAEHDGRIVKLMGDGVLVEFASAVDAVECAAQLQEGMAAANAGQPEERHIALRIGINLGDVIVDGSDLYGDGVNIAARLEAIAEPGSILISGTAHDHVVNKTKVGFDNLGAQTLKNIAEPVRAYRVIGTPAVAVAPPRPSTDRPSIAVLPFTNMSGDPEQEYFSDGITEDVITELSRFRSLLVMARHSSFAFKGKSLTVQEIARQLGVAYVLEGSIRRVGNHCRITAQLIDAKFGNHIWAERFDRALVDIFAVQDQLVGTIVGTIVGRVEASTVEQLRRRPPSNMMAYDCVLKGKALPVGDAEVEAEARRFYEKAIELDPTFGIAYSYLAYALSLEWFREEDISSPKLGQALQLAKKGVQYDDSNSECHAILGWIYLNQREFASAEKSCRRALELNPNNPVCIMELAEWLMYAGRPREALALYEQVTQVDPHYNPGFWLRNLGLVHFNARQYEESLRNFTQSLTSQIWVKCYVAACHAYMGNQEKASGVAAEILRQSPNFSARRLMAMEPYRQAEDQNHFLKGMLKAGLPE